MATPAHGAAASVHHEADEEAVKDNGHFVSLESLAAPTNARVNQTTLMANRQPGADLGVDRQSVM